MTDWNAFCSTATFLLTAYSDSALKRCLVYLDPRVLDEITLKDRLVMRTGVTSGKWGRDACFAKLFQYVLKSQPDLLVNAPPEAQRAYNDLVHFLFTPETAKALLVGSHSHVEQMAPQTSNGAMSLEKRLELFVQRASIFEDLLKKTEQMPSIDELAALEKALDERQNKLLVLKAKRQKLTTLIQNLPKEPPKYLQPVQHMDEWQKLYTIVAPLNLDSVNGRKFEDLAAFEAWTAQEEAFLQEVLKAASVLATAKTVEVAVKGFNDQLKAVSGFLYQTHVAGIAPLLEQKILEGQDESEIKAFLQKQSEKCTEIEQFQKQQAEHVRLESSSYLQQLFTDKFLTFTDLPEEIQRILSLHFDPQPINSLELTDEVIAQYKEQAKTYYEGLLGQMAHLVDAANERLRRLEDMTQYSRVFFVLTAPAKQYKDLYSDYHALEQSMQSLAALKQEFSKGAFEENEKKLQACYEQYLELKANMPEAINRLICEAEQSQQRAGDDKSAIKRRLFEIFWNISPYLDLMESFRDMRRMLTAQLQEGVRAFYSGTLSSSELLGICQEMPYEHDVVKLRNEITHRSARLKDLRDEALRLLVEVQQTRRFLEIADLKGQKAYHDLISQQATVFAILTDVENPFSAFAKAETKDDINYVFRKFWMRIEEVQPLVEQALASALPLLMRAAPIIKGAFLKALDTLEDVVSHKSGTRAQLVAKAEKDLQFASQDELFNLLLSSIHAIEKSYGFCMPFVFFMLVPEHKIRLVMMQEAEALDAHIQETIAFAKAMQYVKTFEEERVDIILEAFEHQHVVIEDSCLLDALKKGWELYRERMHRAARLVEDEIFLDIGLLDRHALMDVDQKELSNTLRQAIARASSHIFEPKYGIFANLQVATVQEPLCRLTLDSLKKSLEEWSKALIVQDASIDWLLEHLRKYCHSLFDAKIILGAKAKMLLPKCLAFMNELKSFVGYIEAALQNKRSEHIAEWGKQWIAEVHGMRLMLECFEPEEEAAEEFKAITKKIFSEVEQIPEYSDLQLTEFQKELDLHLLEIDELAKNPKQEHPFIYIPGYLEFFNRAVETADG